MSEPEAKKYPFQFEYGEHDENHVFDEEKEMLVKLRERLHDLIGDERWPCSDRFLLVFLIARKHDLDRTEKLLRDHFEWRVKWGFNSFADTPRLKDVPDILLKSGQQLHIPHIYDKEGYKLLYKFSSKLLPEHISEPLDMIKYVLWSIDHGIDNDTLFRWRKGVTVVQDMAGFGLKHMSFKHQQHFKNLHDVMPFRPQKIIVLNGGWILPVLLKVAKAFLRAKFLRRMKTLNSEKELHDIIDPEHLLEQYGGTLKYDHMEWYEATLEREEKQAKKKHKKHKHKHHHQKEQPEVEEIPAEPEKKPKKSKKAVEVEAQN